MGRAACTEIGLDVSHSHYQKHGAYLLEHADMPGFPQEEQRILAYIVGAHRRKLQLEAFQELTPPWHIKAQFLILILRLAVLLHRGRSAELLPNIGLLPRARAMEITFPQGWLDSHPLTAADLENEIEYPEGGRRSACASASALVVAVRIPLQQHLLRAHRSARRWRCARSYLPSGRSTHACSLSAR